MRLVKIITRKNKLFLSIVLAVSCISAIGQENSPRSKYGFGDVVPNGNVINRAMGGIAAPYSETNGTTVNFLNPASYARLIVTTFDLGFEIDTRTLRQVNSSGSFRSGSANVSYVMLGIPIMPKHHWGVTLGLRPNTRISYKIQTNERIENVDSVSSLYEGNGGSYEVIGGTGIAFGNLSIGFNAGYLFGTKDYTSKRIFNNDTVDYYRSNHENKSSFGGFSLTGGAQYNARLGKGTWLRLGATAQMQKTYKATRDVNVETFQYDVNGAVFRIDSVYGQNNAKGDLVYPGAYSFGFMLDKELEWSFGAEYRLTKWGDYRFFGQADPLQDAWTVHVGGQWIPDALRGGNYWSHVTYRAGFFYGRDNIKVDNNVPVLMSPQPAVTPPPSRVYESGSPATITPPLSNPNCGGNSPDSWANAPWYLYSQLKDVTINPAKVGSTNRETYVNIVVNGDIKTNLTINQGVNVRIYFTGNADIKVSNFKNSNVDGSALLNIDGTTSTNTATQDNKGGSDSDSDQRED